MRFFAFFIALTAVLFSLSACGGGGAADSTPTVGTANAVVIKTVGPPTTLYGVGFTAELPPGVTLATQPSGALSDGVIVQSGGAAGTVVASYQPGASPQTFMVSFTSLGFPVGEFLRVNPTVAAGTVWQPGDLHFTSFKAYDNLASGVPSGLITGSVTAP